MFNRATFRMVAALALALWGAYMLFPAYVEHEKTKRDLKELDRQLLEQQRVQEGLRQDIHRLKTDPRAIERVARDKFGLCRPGEKVYDFTAVDESREAN